VSAIYFHIPFCKTRCRYCDFFSSQRSDLRDKYVEAICIELRVRRDYLQKQPLETLYFGGGTPSQLSVENFEDIFDSITDSDSVDEITLEANPDDMTDCYIGSNSHLPFNRISLGIQSFDDSELKMLGRRHNAAISVKAVERLQKYGYENISIDLMYGLPDQTEKIWKQNLQTALSLGVQHISAYHLTYEKGTKLYSSLQQGIIKEVSEDTSCRMFEILIETLTNAGFEHYEISNFARKNCRSKHNSSYWNGTHYLGIGAAAHSFNGKSRQWNVASIDEYIKQYQTVGSDIHYAGFEIIDGQTAYNDFIITRLRTAEGIDLNELMQTFGAERLHYCLKQANRFIGSKTLIHSENRLKLTRQGIFVSDGIIENLMV